jgi:hypothetical protein
MINEINTERRARPIIPAKNHIPVFTSSLNISVNELPGINSCEESHEFAIARATAKRKK